MDKEDYIKNIDSNAERRSYAAPIEMRETEEGMIEGIAAVVNSRTDLGYFHEEIARGAFDDVLNDDVRVLFNHDPNLVLARSSNGKGTAQLFINENGDLGYRFKIPNTTVGNDLAENLRLGNVSQSSFAFTVKDQEVRRGTNGEPDVRVITKVERLYDVSPVTYPAYQDTSVGRRAMDKVKEEEPKEDKLKVYKRKLQVLKLKK